MIKPLPYWAYPNSQPAFYDVESDTAIQMVAKLYNKMRELIENYNEFVTDINRTIAEFESGMIEDFECFKNCIIKITNDYIETIDIKINLQNKNIKDKQDEQDEYIHSNMDRLNEQINNAVEYMKLNIVDTANRVFEQALHEGRISATLLETYDSSTESLTFSVQAIESGENNG